MTISTTAIARAYRLAHSHGHGWSVERPQWALELVTAGMPAALAAEAILAAWDWAAARERAERVRAEHAEPTPDGSWLASASDQDASDEAARRGAIAERAWAAVQTWAANAGLDAVITATGAAEHRAPRTVAEALAANAIAEAEAENEEDIVVGLRWTPDAHGDVRHTTCTGATEWYIRADGLVRIRRLDTRIDRVSNILASATIRADGLWRAEVSAEASELDLTRLSECIEAALELPQGAATRGVLLGCDPYDLRRRAERGDARAAAALLPLPVAMQLAEVVR